MKVAEILPHRRFDIFTHPDRISSPPPNVRIHAPVTIDAHRSNLRRAELVVVPTHELQYPTGQSVLLESMACGTATAVTDTPAMREYIRDDQWNFALPRENPVLAAQKIEQILPMIRGAVGSLPPGEPRWRLHSTSKGHGKQSRRCSPKWPSASPNSPRLTRGSLNRKPSQEITEIFRP
ncbi:glycosyltransferase [Neomicrococcus lactis]|uniref:glycosyltransferase n=1 Tax=Neomicrococcus lactis TaxID=732241 RepID=UPI003A5C88D9